MRSPFCKIEVRSSDGKKATVAESSYLIGDRLIKKRTINVLHLPQKSCKYQPSVEYEYLGADVGIEDSDGEKDVAYTEDVEKELDSDSDEQSEENTQN